MYNQSMDIQKVVSKLQEAEKSAIALGEKNVAEGDIRAFEYYSGKAFAYRASIETIMEELK